MTVRAPLVFVIDSDALISPEPSELVEEGDSLGVPDEIMDVDLVLSINNQWSFGAALFVLLGPDSLSIINGDVDTLISGFSFSPGTSMVDTLSLSSEEFSLLKQSPSWIQPQIRIISNNGDPVKFLSTDTLTITIDGLSASIDLSTILSDD